MKNKKKPIDSIPENFSSYDEAAEFWDTHDTTDYLEISHPVKTVSKFRVRHFEIELEESVVKTLRSQAKQKRMTLSHLANNLLRHQLANHK